MAGIFIEPNFDNLRFLSFENCANISIVSLPRLEVLSLAGCRGIKDLDFLLGDLKKNSSL